MHVTRVRLYRARGVAGIRLFLIRFALRAAHVGLYSHNPLEPLIV